MSDGTRIYGASDDLIEFDGEYEGEVGSYDSAALVVCSDGTVMAWKYAPLHLAVWVVEILRTGDLFERLDKCEDEDADPHSDVIHMKSGIKWAYAATEWEKVH